MKELANISLFLSLPDAVKLNRNGTLCAILCHFGNLKNVKNTNVGVILLVVFFHVS